MDKIISALKENVNKIKGDLVVIEDCAKDILAHVERNEFIPDDITSKMINSLQEHKSLKSTCSSLYASVLDETTEINSINILEECIENMEKNSARNLVSIFYKLHSDIEEVEILLNEQKKKLDSILEQTKEIEELEALVKDYIVFAETVNSINETSPQDVLKIMKDLRGTFGDSLPMHAFVENDIYVLYEDSENKDLYETQNKEDIACNKNAGDDNIDIDKMQVKNVADANEMMNSNISEYKNEDDKEIDNKEKTEKCPRFEESLIDDNSIIPNDFDFGIISCEISPKDDYKIGAKSFKNEVSEFLDRGLARDIIVFIHEYNFVSFESLNEFFNNDRISVVLNQMMIKGYLRKYSIVGKGDYYCESKRLKKALKFKEVCNFLKIKSNGFERDCYDDRPSVIMTRIEYAKLFEKSKYYLKTDQNILRLNMIFFESIITIHQSVNYGGDIFICINLTNKNEIDYIEKILTESLKTIMRPKHIIISSVNREYSNKYVDYIATLLNLDKNMFYIYSYEDDNLYSYEKNSVVLFDEIIWPALEVNDYPSEDDSSELFIEQGNNELKEDVESIDLDSHESISNKTPINQEEQEINKNIENDKSSDYSESKLQEVEKKNEKINKDELLSEVYHMINNDNIYCALAYLNSFTKNNMELYNTWRLFAYATNDPLKACRFSSSKMYDVYMKESTPLHDYLFASAALRTFFYNNVEYDYQMKQLYESNIQNLGIVNDCLELKNAFRTIVIFKDTIHKGINEFADYKMQDNVELEKHINEIKRKAKEFYTDKILGRVKERASQQRFVYTKKIVFDKDADIAVYLQAIIDEDKDYYPLMKDYICDTFMKDSSEANIVNIDSIKMDRFMDNAWEEAGNHMQNKMKSSDLMSSLRRNLKKSITAALDIMCQWLSYCGRNLSDEDTAGLNRYKKDKEGLLSDLSCSKKYFENMFAEIVDDATKAGCIIFIKTLDELIRRINGTYNEDEYRYFYIDFLKSDRVLLDDDYLPVMDMNFKTPKGLGISDRILDHSSMELGSFEDRLEEIFKYHGDDFGSAKLIISYLGDYGTELITKNNYNLEESISYGKNGAKKKKQEFLENLELMQSYGQIDNTVENKKDKYLQITNSAFDFCYESNNFGFFRTVTEGFISQIKEDSRQYEETIVSELSEYKAQIKNNDNEQEILERLEDVQKMLDMQNYTAAQDLLSRIKKGDLEISIEILPEDYLVKFIDQYDNNVIRTADSSKSLVSLVSHKLKNPKNKDAKDGRKLIDNWPMPGQSLDSIKLKILLTTLGFNVDTVIKSNKIGKIDNYNVKLKKPENGRKINYKHPIAAFGSYAVNDDFRVAFIQGKTDADRLIMSMKELGNAKHTILVVDYAIDLRDRRRLARKIKEAFPTKVFGVIDRVMILFLAENYNESYINQMLMSVMMPFSYVQPYVWDSGNVMPPEIFMGRDKELKDIESPTGVNIVYGGRQLGKSALLKMARNDIDHDENGRRAVYVDIKGKDYKQSAHKIGQVLHDEGILDDDFDGYEWDDLARLIKNRLNDNNRKIPYLLLLLDEADAFIDSSEKVNFSPLDSLKDIQNVGAGRFKFVIAGLRNIVKYTRNALANNSVLTHLGHTTIVPFNYAEARELLEKPLYYLGLRFPKDKESLVSLIFANANYFPGLIQLYCSKLVEAMTKGDYAGYNQSEVPIYYVEQEHIKKVLAEEGFLQQVREKFEITLRLDEDNYYYIIALLMASLYHNNGYSNGYSAYDILEEGRNYLVKKIEDAGLEKISVFLDELCELNVLRRLKEDRYVFNRYNFFQMMGSREEVDNKLEECMEE